MKMINYIKKNKLGLMIVLAIVSYFLFYRFFREYFRYGLSLSYTFWAIGAYMRSNKNVKPYALAAILILIYTQLDNLYLYTRLDYLDLLVIPCVIIPFILFRGVKDRPDSTDLLNKSLIAAVPILYLTGRFSPEFVTPENARNVVYIFTALAWIAAGMYGLKNSRAGLNRIASIALLLLSVRLFVERTMANPYESNYYEYIMMTYIGLIVLYAALRYTFRENPARLNILKATGEAVNLVLLTALLDVYALLLMSWGWAIVTICVLFLGVITVTAWRIKTKFVS